ncbi:MAG: alpha/beta hydrolase [Candidatus Aminicenantes bacterium]|nr:alpha/beta hydrolase [Candidatus Aminicenantes bacterium]
MKNKPSSIIALIFFLLSSWIKADTLTLDQNGKKESETVLNKKVHIEKDLILDIPRVARWCDRLELKKSRVNIGDCELYVEEEGKGLPVVLIHGGPGATHHYFHPALSQAKDFARIIYYDQRGCGLSDYVAGGGYSVAQAVEDLDSLRKALKIEKWVLFEHSYGGLLAQCYAIKYPENTAGLVLVCSHPGFLDISFLGFFKRQNEYLTEEERKRIKEIHALYIAKELTVEQTLYNAFLNGDWKRQHFYKPSKEKLSQIALYEWKHDTGFNDAMSQHSRKINLKGAFENCPISTILIEGKWDLSASLDKPAIFQKNHPLSQLFMFENSGHCPFTDEPERFFQVLRHFLENLPEIPKEHLETWKEYLINWKKTKTMKK